MVSWGAASASSLPLLLTCYCGSCCGCCMHRSSSSNSSRNSGVVPGMPEAAVPSMPGAAQGHILPACQGGHLPWHARRSRPRHAVGNSGHTEDTCPQQHLLGMCMHQQQRIALHWRNPQPIVRACSVRASSVMGESKG